MATTHDYDIICLSEMFLDSSFNSLDGGINIEGCNVLRTDHPNDNKKRGVYMYFTELSILRRDNLCNLPERLITEIRWEKKASSRASTDVQARFLTSLTHSVLISICFYQMLMI